MEKGTSPSARREDPDDVFGVEAIAARMISKRDERNARRRGMIEDGEKRRDRLAKRRAPKELDPNTVGGVVDEVLLRMRERGISTVMNRHRRHTPHIRPILHRWVNQRVESGTPLAHVREALLRSVKGFPTNEFTVDADVYLMGMARNHLDKRTAKKVARRTRPPVEKTPPTQNVRLVTVMADDGKLAQVPESLLEVLNLKPHDPDIIDKPGLWWRDET